MIPEIVIVSLIFFICLYDKAKEKRSIRLTKSPKEWAD